jgi:hypothetical protein
LLREVNVSFTPSALLPPGFRRLELPSPGMHMLPPGQSLGLVVLPEMTPSPTPRRELYDVGPPPLSAEAAMLGLQAAQTEGVARERLRALEALETALEALETALDAVCAAAAAATEELHAHRAADAARRASRSATLEAEFAAVHATRARRPNEHSHLR